MLIVSNVRYDYLKFSYFIMVEFDSTIIELQLGADKLLDCILSKKQEKEIRALIGKNK